MDGKQNSTVKLTPHSKEQSPIQSSSNNSGFKTNIIARSADGIIVLDDQGLIQFANPAAEQLFGRSTQELLGSPFGFPLVAGETTELNLLRRDRTLLIAEMRVVEMMWDGTVGYLASLRDITERKRHEKKIEAENVVLGQQVEERELQVERLSERINAIFETARDVIILVKADGRIEIANPAVMHKFGYTPGELVNRPLSKLFISAQQKQLDKWVQQLVNDGKSHRQQVSAISKGGTTFDVEISLARVQENDNHVVCVCHDISHFKAVERMKDNFISMVSHELRSPVTSLSLLAGALETFYARYTDQQIKQRLVDLNNQCQILSELLEGILDISRLEAQRGQARQTTAVDMITILNNIVTEFQVDVYTKKQALATFIEQLSISFAGNALDFARIWRNLLSNAIKYTPQGGEITIRLGYLTAQETVHSRFSDKTSLLEQLVDGRTYIIGQVEDNGHGIAPDDIPNLFQRFNRGWAQTSPIPGTGLGLALVRELLTLYHGDIHVSSQLGQGSTFTFWLPIEPSLE